MFDVKGKIVLITGASGGIGMAISKAFADLGAKFALVSRSDEFKKIVSREIKNSKYNPFILKADLGNEDDIERIVKEIEDKYKKIDILINCAGVNIRKNIDDYTSEEWDLILNVNLKSIFTLTNKVANIMKEYSYGKIINISSIQGVICWTGDGKFNLAPYCSSKAGLISLTKSFALALAAHNINVNVICPAVVDGKWAWKLKDDPAIFDDIIRRTPLKRLAKNSDLVGPALFLATEASNYVTGHTLMVDGGWTVE